MTGSGKSWLSWVTLMVVAAGCGSQVEPPAVEDSAEDEAAVVAVTQWSDRSELFMEYPPLVANETARFAIHLTALETFEAVDAGHVVVTLDGVERAEFAVDSPSVPGIFGVDVTPDAPGRYRLAIELESETLRDLHDVGVVTVHPDVEAARAQLPEEETSDVLFLKEQQWTLDFATESAQHRELRQSFVAPGMIQPRAGGQVDVSSPLAGRITPESRLPMIGTSVRRGQVLAEILPWSESVGDRASLEFDLVEARATLQLAEATQQRTARLVEAGALPTRRTVEATVGVDTAKARIDTASARLEHLDQTRTGEGDVASSGRVSVRTPIEGIVATAQMTPGATVETGQVLFQVISIDRVHVVANVPESEISRLADAGSAELEAPGLDEPIALDQLVSVGRIVDPLSRTVPIVYELAELDARLAIGQTVTLRLFTSGQVAAITVPDSAVIEDGGQPVVFVQTGGESFTRRPVRLGGRAGGYVQLLDGVEPGERVVTQGATLIRLAALSPSVPAHGHVH